MNFDQLDRAAGFVASALWFTARSICLSVPTFLVIYVVGTVSMTALFGISTGTPHLFISHDLAGVPILYYAFLTSLHLAVRLSFVVWILATVFAAAGTKQKPFVAWLTFLSIFGGLTATLFVMTVDAPRGYAILVAFPVCFFGVAVVSCAMLSPLWFFAYHKRLSL